MQYPNRAAGGRKTAINLRAKLGEERYSERMSRVGARGGRPRKELREVVSQLA
jgi:hypothetical protein